jgi:hypothetical protein
MNASKYPHAVVTVLLTLQWCWLSRTHLAASFNVARRGRPFGRTVPRMRPVPWLTAAAASKNWDQILEEYTDEDEDTTKSAKPSVSQKGSDSSLFYFVPRDMEYNPRNCQRQHVNFIDIREIGGAAACTRDVYVRQVVDPQATEDTFWFVGKIAMVSDVSAADAVRRQRNLIETHAVNLQPLILLGARNALEIWLAPGDSEIQVAYNNPDVSMERITTIPQNNDAKVDEIHSRIKKDFVGFQGEMYGTNEEGFRTWRRIADGRPARPPVAAPDATTTPPVNNGPENEQEYRDLTDAEMAQLQKALEGKDINAVYEEQERRKQEVD